MIDHTLIKSPFNILKETITSSEKYATTMKTLLDNNVFPKTTNTKLTVYYTTNIKSSIPEVTNTTRKALLRYICEDDTYPAITISVFNFTQTDLQLHIAIYKSDNTTYKQYVVTADTPKQVIDLTADLADARQEKKLYLLSLQVLASEGI
jgi:hypothetical protein